MHASILLYLASSLHIGVQETRDANAPIGDVRVLDPVVSNFTKP